jgi:hypothetical protein
MPSLASLRRFDSRDTFKNLSSRSAVHPTAGAQSGTALSN